MASSSIIDHAKQPLPPTPASVTAQYSTHASGRGLFVSPSKPEGFSIGETVLQIVRPMVAIPDDQNLDKCCSWCLVWVGDGDGEDLGGKSKKAEGYGDPEEQEREEERKKVKINLKKCTGCKVVWYCSPACQKLDWLHGPHKHECPIFSALHPRILPVSVRSLVRLLLLHKYKHGVPLSGRPVEDKGKWWEEEVLAMEAHEEKYDNEMITLMSLAAEKYSGTKIGLRGVKELYCRILLNSFAISAPLPQDEGVYSSTTQKQHTTIGNLFDPLAALINHSCAPNCVLEFCGREVVVTCIRPVRVGEELTFSYIDEKGKGLEERRRELEERWFFLCRCEKCLEEERGTVKKLDDRWDGDAGLGSARIVELE
ncbi:hypothetical protein DFH27DRAFT_598952 [Peziza echinospora]|nr:hypothetical protein DFH27DRAFT_598952 [Peziza echinospora]